MQYDVGTAWSTVDLRPAVRPPDESRPGHPELRQATSVLISDLILGCSPRLVGEDAEHVRILTEVDAALPPILVHRQSMRVIDGLHRVRAACAKGERTICARFFDGTDNAAFILAVESNIAHGLPLTTADRKAAAARIIGSHGHWSDRAIAASTGLADRTVRTLRQNATPDTPRAGERIGQDGRSRPLSIVEARILASEIMIARPTVTLRVVAEAAGVSVGTAHDAMPQKRNPVLATAVAAAARQAPVYALVLHQSMVAEDERSAGAWHAEWQPLRECLRLAAGAAVNAAELTGGLVVHADRMSANLAATGALVVSERIGAALGPLLGRTAAKRLLAEAVQESGRSGRSLVDVLAETLDGVVGGAGERVDHGMLAALAVPEQYTGSAQALVGRVLGRYRDAAAGWAPRRRGDAGRPGGVRVRILRTRTPPGPGPPFRPGELECARNGVPRWAVQDRAWRCRGRRRILFRLQRRPRRRQAMCHQPRREAPRSARTLRFQT